MTSPLKLISTDFDGTLFAEFENPPIPGELQELIATLQKGGARWVINTGRDMSSLMEALARAGIEIEPDYLVLVEREIHLHHEAEYTALHEWNSACERDQGEVFRRVREDLPRLVRWIEDHFHARIYEDPYSPLCIITSTNSDMDRIHAFLSDYCSSLGNLTVVRNDVYARFSHIGYNKGTALSEVTRRLGLTAADVFAAGDHLNDLPMLDTRHAKCLVAPANAVEPVKSAVRRQGGYVSELSHGSGVAEGLKHYLQRH